MYTPSEASWPYRAGRAALEDPRTLGATVESCKKLGHYFIIYFIHSNFVHGIVPLDERI
jgi:hypothetical protein